MQWTGSTSFDSWLFSAVLPYTAYASEANTKTRQDKTRQDKTRQDKTSVSNSYLNIATKTAEDRFLHLLGGLFYCSDFDSFKSFANQPRTGGNI